MKKLINQNLNNGLLQQLSEACIKKLTFTKFNQLKLLEIVFSRYSSKS